MTAGRLTPTNPARSSPDPLPTIPADLLAAAPLFARVFRHSPVGLLIIDAAGRFVAANAALSRMLGRPATTLIGGTPRELGLLSAAGDEPPPAPGHRADVSLRLIGGDGRPRELIASLQPTKIGGRPYTVALVQDLSEFTRLNAAVDQSEARFRLFFENAPLALVVSDAASGTIVDVNPAACRQYGCPRADFLARPPADLQPMTGIEPGLARHTTAGGQPLVVEVTTFTFDLAHRPLRMTALRDVTGETAAVEALRDSERRFRIVTEVSSDGLWDWDLTSDHAWSKDGLLTTGQMPQTPPSPWSGQAQANDRKRGRAEFERAVAAGEPGWSSEYRLPRPNGTWATILQRGVILYHDGRPVRAIGATVDITAPLQLAEAQAQATLAERERLARDLHDSVTQSLYSVSLLAEAARRHALDGQQPEAADYISRLGGLAQQALRQMRLLVYELRPAVLDGEGLIGALRHRLDSVERQAGIAANLVIRGERPVPIELQGQMFHIAHEALNNALRYAAATTLTIRLDTLGNPIVLEIIDNGRGFDATGEHPGLGLSTMRRRAEQLGGELAVLSTPGQSTTVRLIIPTA